LEEIGRGLFDILSWNLPEKAEGNHEKPKSGYEIFLQTFEPRILSRMIMFFRPF
jgi:hypothetical protein